MNNEDQTLVPAPAVSPNPQQHSAHYSKMSDDNWGTPPWIIEAATNFLGKIDLDPASDAFRNRTVRAERFLGLGDVNKHEGIPTEWDQARAVFCNPPGGKVRPAWSSKGVSTAGLFWRHLEQHCMLVGGVSFVWYCYNINQLQVLQRFAPTLFAGTSVCVPSSRVQNIDRTGKARGGTPSAAAILGRGTKEKNFADAFRKHGVVWVRHG